MFNLDILFDHQIFYAQDYGGISKYFSELMSQLDSRNVNFKLALLYSNNVNLNNKNFSNHKNIFPELNFIGKRTFLGFFNYLNQKNTEKLLLSKKFDIFHPTYFSTYYLPYLGNTKLVSTFHDMAYEVYPDLFHDYQKVTDNMKKIATASDSIVAVSNYTKNDLCMRYGIDKSKVKVIYHGCDFSIVKKDPSVSLPEKFILFVGNRAGYKNFLLFLKSISLLLHKDSSLHLVCGGGGKFSQDEEKLITTLGLGNKVIQVGVDDSILAYLYSKAKVFVFPSKYEGFGIPILEAFNAGCPVVLSKSSCFPEIAGDAALYFDPESESSIRISVERVIYNNKLSLKLINRGKKRAKLFSWKKAADETLKVYAQLVG